MMLAKTQDVRLADVFLIGPAMVLGGYRLRQSSPLLSAALVLFGVLTVTYNAGNWARVQAGETP